MRRLHVLLTFDHAPAIAGGREDPEQTFFEPTRKLLWAAADMGVRLTLFTDVLAALRFRDWEPVGFFEPYLEQISSAVRSGHDAQLFLRPLWVAAQRDEGRVRRPRRASLAAFADNPPEHSQSIESIVRSATQYLTALGRVSNPGYRVVAHRTTALWPGPAIPRLVRALWVAGVRIDSTIAKGLTLRGAEGRADYRDLPAVANWRIAPEGPLHVAAAQGLLEVPIGCRRQTTLECLKHFLRNARKGDGRGGTAQRGSRVAGLRGALPRSVSLLGFDDPAHTPDDLLALLRDYVQAHEDDEEIFVAAVSHPGRMDTDARKRMRDFVKGARKEYAQDVRFPTCRGLVDRLERRAERNQARPRAASPTATA